MRMNWVIAETWTPRWVAPAITGLASVRTSAAGMRVTSGASNARKAMSSSTMMNRSENFWISPIELFDWLCWSTKAGIVPVRWNCSPVASRGNVARIPATREIASLPARNGGRPVTTCACSAWRSGESPKSCTRTTPESPRMVVSTAAIRCVSAVERGAP